MIEKKIFIARYYSKYLNHKVQVGPVRQRKSLIHLAQYQHFLSSSQERVQQVSVGTLKENLSNQLSSRHIS